MSIRQYLYALCSLMMLVGCSSPSVQAYAQSEPQLDLFSYFAGETQAYGQFQDRSGAVKRRFNKVSVAKALKHRQN